VGLYTSKGKEEERGWEGKRSERAREQEGKGGEGCPKHNTKTI